MSMCDDFMICNYNKCRTKLSGYAWVTACSHIFCDQHGSGEFSQSPAVCPACNNTLTGKLDIVRVELNPSDEYKAVVLAGLRPEIILDISSRAITFWTYQIHQERLYQEYVQSKAEGKLKQMEKFYTQHMQSKDAELASVKGELSSIKKVLEEYKRKYSEVSEKLMERNRQYQKLQGLYDNMRLRNMVVNNQEAENCLSSHLFTFNPGQMNCHTPKSTPVRGTAVDPEIRQMFFRSPAKDNDKTDGRKAAFFQFGSPNNNQELCGCKGNTFYSKKH
ncbi:E3 ubiquitin-protein ligase CCNB1IP1 [Polypterus senegalus]|uniref:E3 ubiquitin-protein ligase CCNB1IP1 n=1 Tax=Polypterus senegalus TaxID=55291 RepID=UPI001962394A|nr:E3 ubiquitin-protein ligase CCNB1IP1 [Polypterus senegalus]